MKLLFSFDDATIEDYKTAELMSKYGFTKNTVFYFPVYPQVANSPKRRTSLSEEQMQYIADRYEIGSHTLTHPLLTRIPLEIAKLEIINSKIELENKYKKSVTKFCYPRGYANKEIRNIVKDAGYESARNTLVGYIEESEDVFFQNTTVHCCNDRKEYAGAHWLEYAIMKLEDCAKKENSVFHLWGHGYEIQQYMHGFRDLEKLLKLIREKYA